MAPFLVLLIGLWADTAQAQPFAYISNNLSNNVSVIDTVTNSVVATVPVGTGPFGVAVNRAGTRVYVTNRESNTLSVIDTETNMVRATVPVGVGPFGVAANPAGARVYVANTSSNDVSVIDTETNTVVDTVGLPPPILMSGGVAVNPAGTRVYVTGSDFGVRGRVAVLTVIDTATNTVVDTVGLPLPPAPGFSSASGGVAVNPAGTRVYVAHPISSSFFFLFGGIVSVIDTATNTRVATVLGGGTRGVAVNPTGTHVYVANTDPPSSNTVSVIDTATNAVVATVPVGTDPFGVAVNPAGSRVYVANTSSNTVSVIDTATNAVVATVSVGTGPTALGLFIGPGIVTPAPTLSQWGMILLALTLLAMATWQLAGRPTLLRAATSTGLVVWSPSTNLLRSVCVGQAVAGLGLVLYVRLIEPLAAHDVIGAVLSGVVLGVLLESYRQGRERRA